MSIKDFIFGAPKLVDNVFDKDKGLLTQVGQWVGNQQFTPEEQAIHDAAIGEGVRAFAIATMGENTDRSKTRRHLAQKWFDMQIWLIKLQVLCFFMDKFIILVADKNLELSIGLWPIVSYQGIWAITSGIGLFFWGSHALRGSKWAKDK